MAVARVLVTDAQHRASLAAIRCLGAAGHRVSAVASTHLAPGLWSRACSCRSVVARVSQPERFVTDLVEFLRREPQDILVPGTDLSLYVASCYRARIEPHVALGLPTHQAVRRALSKACLATEAAAVGIATPAARVCSGPREALATAREYGYPVLVKPLEAVVDSGGRLTHHSSRLAVDEPGLRRLQAELGTCIVQQRIRGVVVSLAGVLTGAGMLGSVLARHRRTWPPDSGSASFVESLRPDAELTHRVQALVEAIGWRGLWQLQFIERADGVLHAIDFNPRPYGCMGLAQAAGVPLTSLWCASLLGETPKPMTARPGVRWRMEDSDARNILWQWRHGHRRTALRAALPEPRTDHAFFRRRDPVPLLVRAAQLGSMSRRRMGDD